MSIKLIDFRSVPISVILAGWSVTTAQGRAGDGDGDGEGQGPRQGDWGTGGQWTGTGQGEGGETNRLNWN